MRIYDHRKLAGYVGIAAIILATLALLFLAWAGEWTSF